MSRFDAMIRKAHEELKANTQQAIERAQVYAILALAEAVHGDDEDDEVILAEAQREGICGRCGHPKHPAQCRWTPGCRCLG